MIAWGASLAAQAGRDASGRRNHLEDRPSGVLQFLRSTLTHLTVGFRPPVVWPTRVTKGPRLSRHFGSSQRCLIFGKWAHYGVRESFGRCRGCSPVVAFCRLGWETSSRGFELLSIGSNGRRAVVASSWETRSCSLEGESRRHLECHQKWGSGVIAKNDFGIRGYAGPRRPVQRPVNANRLDR